MQQFLNPNNSELAVSYNDIPYTSYVFSHCQPTRLHALAKIKGFDPVPVETAKILEIGCSFGGNLVPFAIRHPHSFTVGIDLSQEQINIGQQMIQHIGLQNVELVAADISNVSFNIKFDYIICHGVFSWVPDFVQDAILEVIQQNLSPKGIAFISYNTYPGWKIKEIAKDFMLFGSNSDLEKMARVEQSFEMMKFTQNILKSKNDAVSKINCDNFEHIMSSQKNYIAHEYFEIYNKPFYFRQFIDKINNHSLSYIADSSTPTIFTQSIFKDNQYNDIRAYFNNKLENIEQYIDFIQNRQFRCSIITHQSHSDEMNVTNNIDNYFLCYHFFDLYIFIDSFYLSSKEDGNKEWVLVDKNISFKSTTLNDALFSYLQKANSACKVKTIFEALKDNPEYNEEELKGIIWTIIHLHNVYLSFDEKKNTPYGKKPHICHLYRNWISFIENNPNITALANKYYYTIGLSPLIKYLVPHLDGTKTMKDLILIVREAFDNEFLVIEEDGKKLTNKEISDSKIRSYIKMDLEHLAAHGFFNHYS